jgi:hypothetical protein
MLVFLRVMTINSFFFNPKLKKLHAQVKKNINYKIIETIMQLN